jgi:hypothetical protein
MTALDRILGTGRTGPADIDDQLPRRVPGREAQRLLAAESVELLRALAQRMTEFTALLQGQVINNVLEVATVVVPATGDALVQKQYQAAVGSVEVNNTSTHTVTVVSGSNSGATPPTSGTGVYQVAAGATRLVNIGAREFTLYGTAGDTFGIQVFTRGGMARPTLDAVLGGGV